MSTPTTALAKPSRALRSITAPVRDHLNAMERAREVYFAKIQRAESEYFERVQHAMAGVKSMLEPTADTPASDEAS